MSSAPVPQFDCGRRPGARLLRVLQRSGERMKLPKRFQLTLVCLAMINMVPAAMPGVQGEDGWGIFCIAAGAAVASCLLRRPERRRRWTHLLFQVPVLATVAFLAYEMFAQHAQQTIYLIDLAHFMMLLCACKFFDLHGNRDMGLVALMSFLMLVISAFVSASALFAVVLVIDLTVGVGWLLAFQRRCVEDEIAARSCGAAGDAEFAGASPDADVAGSSHRSHIWTTSLSSLAMVTIAAAVFVGIPRGWGSEIFGGLQRIVGNSVTGITDQVRLNDTTIFENNSPVMRVQFFRGGTPITDEDFTAYMRGQTFDRYQSAGWRRTPTVFPGAYPAGTLDAPRPLTRSFGLFPAEELIEQHVFLEASNSTVLFSMYPPLIFGSDSIPAVQMDRRDLVLATMEQRSGTLRYVVHSATRVPPEAARRLDRRPRLSRDGPSEIPPRVASFAQDFAARYGDPTDTRLHGYIARLFRDYLSSDEFEYTLDRGTSSEGVDAVEDFLFANKRGHCEYFASALTVLCQAVGIRARLVGGFCGGKFNAVGRFYQFRQKDAHAWVEVYLPDRGWITLDPSPPTRSRAVVDDDSLLARARRIIEFLQFKWSTVVVSFDADSRAGLVEGFSGWFAKLQQQFQGGPERPASLSDVVQTLLWGPALLPVWQRVLYWLLLLLCCVMIALCFRVCWILSLMLREYLAGRKRSGARVARQTEARFYDRILLLLANKGHRKPEHLTPLEFAIELAKASADFRELPRFTEWFYQAQYGAMRLDEQRRQRLRTFLQQLREDVSFGT